jgi:hypothetical protein
MKNSDERSLKIYHAKEECGCGIDVMARCDGSK